ncbi:RHS repeat-associated core domain-containing protein, partial [Paenibacillus sp. Leaf72]|uniref:RHS repeat-associated core domain-containing protein n=1 Tax=Paenibacillus sp. Leaf72 TaxID=1736234 RepID=UPI003FA7D58D
MGRYQSYHYDLRGSTTLLTDENVRVTDHYTYGLYGEREHHEGTTRQPFCYNGRDGVMTNPNGLYYMRARYYHTGIKRFLNRDVLRGSILEGQTFNRFGYVNGDP